MSHYTTYEQHEFLTKCVEGTWIHHIDTGLVDVEGHVVISPRHIKNSKLPISFGRVTGDFICANCDLDTLEGSPYWVGVNFNCSYCGLTNLKYAPIYVGDALHILGNHLNDIDDISEYIGSVISIDLDDIYLSCRNKIIDKLLEISKKGVHVYDAENALDPYLAVYYQQKMIEVL